MPSVKAGSLSSYLLPSPRCPKCGATLLTNGKVVWCSFIGGRGVPACDYGIAERALLVDALPDDPPSLRTLGGEG